MPREICGPLRHSRVPWARAFSGSRSKGFLEASKLFQRSDVGPDADEIVLAELCRHGFHQLRPFAVSRARLVVIELANEIARRTAGKSRHRSHAVQVGAVADGARCRLAVARLHEGFAFL